MNPDPIPLSYPCFRGNEQVYVLDCLKSEWVSTGGAYVSRFEQGLFDAINTHRDFFIGATA
jgi:perosamine synthetase